jgi:anti-sigma factor RsiW
MTVRDPATLTCREVVELLSDLLGDALQPDDRGRLEQHLLVCPPCTLHLAQLRTSISLTQELRQEAEPAAALAVFRRWKARA